MRKEYPIISEGEQVIVDWKKHDFKMACCDCSLVHRMRFRISKTGEIVLQMWRDKRATAALRRGRKCLQKE
jgi:hypothetical protein